MQLSDFDFDLPDESIALRPAVPRDSARLLEIKKTSLTDRRVYDLPERLQSGDVLVINTTRVFPASLTAIRKARPHGGGGDVNIQVNLHKADGDDGWWAFVKPAKRLRIEDRLYFSESLTAVVIEKNPGGDVLLRFSQKGSDLHSVFEEIGVPPLPPYIARQRSVDSRDNDDYQTVYADQSGSVAAPTAGLHFTSDLMNKLLGKGVKIAELTLHVGAGTFLPVKTSDLSEHKMHEEWYEISQPCADLINNARASGNRVIAVGTTSLRALESASQDGVVKAGAGNTGIFITPGYDFQAVDGLMTNFHLPKSTLFMLVCALGGIEVMKKAYQHAISTGYRFYSYGDSSLIWRQ